MRKRCPADGRFEALVYGDAQAYTSQSKFNKPGTIPLAFTSQIEKGCPHDCGLCPDHQQHACLGIIEINSTCNMQCPLCFADAGARFRSEEHTSELQSHLNLVCRLLLEKKTLSNIANCLPKQRISYNRLLRLISCLYAPIISD